MPETADLRMLKVLANPLRQRIMRQLARDGEATSTTLARKLGVTTGGTSYNLRVLAAHGFVAELPDRGSGRERWWRVTSADLRFPRYSRQSEEMRAVLAELNQAAIEQDTEALGRFLARRSELGEWQDALPYSRGSIRVTLTELTDFFDQYLELLSRFARPDEEVPEDARSVLTYFVAFPDVPEN